MSADPFDQHDWQSAAYVERWVATKRAAGEQRAQDLHRVVAALPAGHEAPRRVLDIGTGWGPLAREVLMALPGATLVAHDFSAPMLEKAEITLGPFGERASFWRGDLTDAAWAQGIGGPFDAVVSAHAIHNVRSHATIAAVYSTVGQLLSPGGWFVNLEIVDPAGPATGGAYGRLRTGAGGVRAPHQPGHDLAAATLVDHLRWLTDAGFAEVDCLWKDTRQALLVGVTPSGSGREARSGRSG
jgi:tRNA (cmo5U34)-methyltransferase